MTTTVQQRFEEALEKARDESLKSEEEYVSSLFANGQETVDFRFDGFSFWNKSTSGGAEELWNYLHEQRLGTDSWNRTVWSLTKEQALTIARLVEEWNADWEYAVAGKFAEELHEEDPDFDQMMYYNAYHIGFSPASGTEHTIRAGAKGMDTAWQWN